MHTPETELDTRFSDPDAVASPWAQARQALETAELFWICTVRADGRPHVSPLVAVWLDDALHFCTGPAEQKAMNLEHSQHVILLTGCNQWDAGLDVVVEMPSGSQTSQRCWLSPRHGPRSGTGDGIFRSATEASTMPRAKRWCSRYGRRKCSDSEKVRSATPATSSDPTREQQPGPGRPPRPRRPRGTAGER